MILFMPWPVQKYITTHLYIIAEFVEGGKWGRRCLLLRFALAPPPHALRVIPELLRTSLALCALFQYCFALLSRFARYSSIASHFSRALRVIPVLLRTSCSRNSARHSHSGLSAFVFMSRHPVKCATCREQALACARLTGF